ncbi:glycosyltransferase involved in cell wall biosynthesis [Mucilaginibacter frigoritolerans]|uniref:Glycosyltransferase involved in cell wall biosynthesis n=1 Tax=Mucilaginibacter frigoritolerans TaxID=652788 RepID=A0A562U6K5_9SPHI|nr:glycosyltransferase [Mucilaginibacter frigoritolerans]TWJ00791.1 glycosyltransferase involved in cell wall biosynthesis [Mucilaginibacter frigoritolerans]
MRIVFFTHPEFSNHQSMPRFANMLINGMKSKKHEVEIWTPKPYFFNLKVPASLKKWMGYTDQYLIFPLTIRKRIKRCSKDTIFAFCDQALGPWVPLVADRLHVIHCHDFLAQRSALRQIPENPVSWSGRQYQALIKRGYSTGKNFISVSEKTRSDLHSMLKIAPLISEVVYNGLNQLFSYQSRAESRNQLTKKLGIDLANGFILHVGGNQWYKNRTGVIEIYNAWRKKSAINLPLLMIGYSPSLKISEMHSLSPYKADIHLISGLNDEFVRMAYAGASVFLFPSLAEGFGWPIAEAMASACPVITTNEAPMTEVAGKAAFFIPKRPYNINEVNNWAQEAADLIDYVLQLPETVLNGVIESGLKNVKRFEPESVLEQIESIYKNISLQSENKLHRLL